MIVIKSRERDEAESVADLPCTKPHDIISHFTKQAILILQGGQNKVSIDELLGMGNPSTCQQSWKQGSVWLAMPRYATTLP